MPRLYAMLSLVAAMSMTGANVPFAKILLASFPLEVLLLLRFALASAVLAVVVRGEKGPRLSSLGLRGWCAVAVLSVVGSVLFSWTALEGVRRTSGASAGIILAALPVVVAIAGVALGERFQRGDAAMVALATAGLVLIQVESALEAAAGVSSAPWLGNLLVAGAVLCEAAFVIVARGVSRQIRPMRLSLAVALASFVVSVPIGLTSLLRFDASAPSLAAWALLVWYALTSSIVCTALWYRGVAHVEAWAAGLATTAVPVAALAVSVVVLDEALLLPRLAGAALVIAAIAVGTLSRRPGE
jgi:drug/metabolite transporter (DMT)-like permease